LTWLLPRDALLAAICQIGHVPGYGRYIPDFDIRIRLLARAHAVNEIRHVILIGSISNKCSAVGTIDLFWEIASRFLGFSRHHVLLSGNMLDRAVTAQDVFAQSVMTVAEGRLPVHDDVLWKFERY